MNPQIIIVHVGLEQNATMNRGLIVKEEEDGLGKNKGIYINWRLKLT